MPEVGKNGKQGVRLLTANKINIAKGTTGPRVEFILQVLRKINAPIESPVVDAVAEQKTAR